MSSTFVVLPSQYLNDGRQDPVYDQRAIAGQDNLARPSTPFGSSHLSPLSAQILSGSASPAIPGTSPSDDSTPASLQYQTSDFSSSDVGDEFFGVDFSNLDGGTPSFLEDATGGVEGLGGLVDPLTHQTPNHNYTATDGSSQAYPLSPEQTPSLHNTSPQNGRQGLLPSAFLFEAKAAEDTFEAKADTAHPQYTPDTSDDGVAPAFPTMPAQSPRVTVSLWGKDGDAAANNMGPTSHLASTTGFAADGGFAPTSHGSSLTEGVSRDAGGRWVPDASTGQGGIGPSSRLAFDTTSANDLATKRAIQARNQEVDDWISGSSHQGTTSSPNETLQPPVMEGVSDREISLGDETRNVMQPGRTYYIEDAVGPMTQDDVDIMRQTRTWEDAPTVFPIFAEGSQRYQPETSSAAMTKFERMCRDNDSIVSRAATWGTRRRSLPSVVDMEGIVSGNFFKKLSISRGEPRRPAVFLKELRTLVRKPSASNLANLKRSLSSQEEDPGSTPSGSTDRRESRDSLRPPSRSTSWGKRPTPSINTALVGMGSNIAAIGTTHARSGSISTTTPSMSPKSPFSLKVANTINRRRSKSDLPRLGTDNSFSNITDLWKRTGGPPVATLAKPAPVVDQDDDDEDDEDPDDADMSSEATKLIDEILPNFSGFQQHILKLNPMLSQTNNYLVDRIAHQQIIRYKSLLNAKVKHIGQTQNRSCQCGQMCIALGGSAVVLDNKGDARSLDPLSARFQGSDDDISTPLEGSIAPECFPQDIPMPPTQTLPAEFECQLCFTAKKFQKPSDWTKHVHEDVQPFTCTWDRCRDAKIFKRKADWVRHENEGHRHLEWWTCDVEDCRHTCYRRDNFLQHLVREHKFSEPKVKTKAAIKRAGAPDPTWQKVERCHAETQARPQDEPCRFCGKAFPTWKKLTVHLAKHMEQISLPILRLVARKQLDADTIISPVQEPPQRPFAPTPVKQEPQPFGRSPGGSFHQQQYQGTRNALNGPSPVQFQSHQAGFGFPVPSAGAGVQLASPQYQQIHTPFESLGSLQNMGATVMDMTHVSPSFQTQQQTFMNLPVTTGAYVAMPQSYMPTAQVLEGFGQISMPQQMDSMGLQSAGASSMNYDSMMDAANTGGAQFTPQRSASPYSRSPHQQTGNFY